MLFLSSISNGAYRKLDDDEDEEGAQWGGERDRDREEEDLKKRRWKCGCLVRRGRREEKDEDGWSRWCEIDLYLTGKKGKKEGGCVFRVYTIHNFPVGNCTYFGTKAQRVEGGVGVLGVQYWENWLVQGLWGGGGEISLWQEESGGLAGDWSNHEIP